MVLADLISLLKLVKGACHIAGYRLGSCSSRGGQVSQMYCTAGDVPVNSLVTP